MIGLVVSTGAQTAVCLAAALIATATVAVFVCRHIDAQRSATR